MLFDGLWVGTKHNPAAAARNEYNDDIYEHVEHWITLGSAATTTTTTTTVMETFLGQLTGWVQNPTGKFKRCPRQGFHGCLSNYLPVGSIQFMDTWL